MWNRQIPNDIEFSVFSDRRMCGILENDTVDTIDLAHMSEYNVRRCPECGRLYVFKGSENKILRVYKPEDD